MSDTTIKTFVLTYALFTAILLFFGIATGTQAIKEISVPENITYGFVFTGLNMIIQVANFILSLLIWTIAGQTFLNIILWGFRVIIILELGRYIRNG